MKLKFQGTISGEGYGYVYIMSYPNSDKVKIGHTINPSTRASQIGGTLAPETPIIEFLFWCAERREAVERATHKLQKHARANGEWFNLSVADAIKSVEHAARNVGVATQVAFDRNEYEAKAAAELQQKIASVPNLSDDELIAAHSALVAREFAHQTNYKLSDTEYYIYTAYDHAVKQEYTKITAKLEQRSREAWASFVENIPSLSDKELAEKINGRAWAYGRSRREFVPDHVKPALRAEREAREARTAKIKQEEAASKQRDLLLIKVFGGVVVLIMLMNYIAEHLG